MIIAYHMLTIVLLLQHVIYCVIVCLVINIFLIKKLCNFIFVVIYVHIHVVDPAVYLINLQLTQTYKVSIELRYLFFKG